MKITTYGELKKNDVIIFHGAEVEIKDVRICGVCDNEFHKGEKIINFTIEPNNKEALAILGNFYSHGTYGGVESIQICKI